MRFNGWDFNRREIQWKLSMPITPLNTFPFNLDKYRCQNHTKPLMSRHWRRGSPFVISVESDAEPEAVSENYSRVQNLSLIYMLSTHSCINTHPFTLSLSLHRTSQTLSCSFLHIPQKNIQKCPKHNGSVTFCRASRFISPLSLFLLWYVSHFTTFKGIDDVSCY